MEVRLLGTNFYMMTKNKELVETYFPCEYEIVDSPYFGYEIHIGKRSLGWKPCFEWHEKAYKSVEEMKNFISDHSNDIEIYDEYDDIFTLEELQSELIDWSEQQRIRYMKYIPEGVPDEVFGGKTYLIESTKDDYDITIPFDHIKYDKLDPYNEKRWRDQLREPMYIKDKDGYDFMRGRFS